MKVTKLCSILFICSALLLIDLETNAEFNAPADIQPINAPFPMPELTRPVFQDKHFNIADYGAVEGGTVKNTDAIARAIKACNDAGGGRVVVPAGKWLTGAVHLKSNVNLHITEAAELIFSDDPADYLPVVHTTWEGMECLNYSPLIYAYQCENIAITGKGKLICSQYKWRRWMNRPPAHMQGLKELYEMAVKNVPVKERNMVRDDINMRPAFIQPNRCKNVLIENVTIRNSPFWTVHPVLCENVIIRGIDVKCRGRNTDGVDPEFCKNVLIEYCRFDQGDDPIVIKAGRNHDAWRIGKCSENIVIRHCTVILGHNLLAIGSEMSGGVRNVYMHDCDYQPYEGFVRSCVLIKTNHRRGGFVENIYVDNIKFNGSKPAKALLEIDTDVLYQWRDLVPTYETRLTKIKNIQIKNVTAGELEYGIWIRGDKDQPVRDIILENVRVSKITKKTREIKNAENIQLNSVQFGADQPASSASLKFDFGSDAAADGFTCITPDTRYSPETGYGFITSADSGKVAGSQNALTGDFCTSDKPIMFTADVPEEGNYRVTVTLGGDKASKTFVKAESRRLMLENIVTKPNETKKLTFIVNIRNSLITEGRSVRLKPREKQANAFHWDNSFTLEFNGENPCVCAVEIEKADNLPTIFLCGDSTVNDQTEEPWTSWGQMLTRFFKPDIAIANYAESGETLGAFKGERRLEKIETQIKPGDYMFIQFAHNDMKRGTPEQVGYQKTLLEFINVARKHNANPVLVTSMHRRRFDSDGKVIDTMSGYPEAMKAVANKERDVPLIDLHSMSRKFYEAMGPENSAKAFVDGTHHNAYGAYQLAKCIVEGIKTEIPQLAIFLADGLPDFEPAKPEPVDAFFIPASPMQSDIKPEGS